MKGTRPRGATHAEDVALAYELAETEKERAENLMIVDMVRNDLGRVCRAGSVRVPTLYAVEPYRTVWQMTSTVVGDVNPRATLGDIMRGHVPGRLHHRRAQAPHHGDHRRARDRAPRRLHRRGGPLLPGRGLHLQHRHPHHRPPATAAAGWAPVREWCGTPSRPPSTTRPWSRPASPPPRLPSRASPPAAAGGRIRRSACERRSPRQAALPGDWPDTTARAPTCSRRSCSKAARATTPWSTRRASPV